MEQGCLPSRHQRGLKRFFMNWLLSVGTPISRCWRMLEQSSCFHCLTMGHGDMLPVLPHCGVLRLILSLYI